MPGLTHLLKNHDGPPAAFALAIHDALSIQSRTAAFNHTPPSAFARHKLAPHEPTFTLLQLITHGGGACPVPFEFFNAAMSVYTSPVVERPHSTDFIYAFTPGTGDSEGHPYHILRVGSTVLDQLLSATDGSLNIEFADPSVRAELLDSSLTTALDDKAFLQSPNLHSFFPCAHSFTCID